MWFLEPQTYSSIQEDSFVSEVITTAKDDSLKKSVTDSPKTEFGNSVESSPEETKRVASERGAKYKTNQGRSASESSIPEEVLSQYSLDESPGTPNRRYGGGAVLSFIEMSLDFKRENTFEYLSFNWSEILEFIFDRVLDAFKDKTYFYNKH